MKVLLAAAVAAFLTCLTSVAVADDWVAVKLRGAVFQLIDGEWEPLRRGDVVADSRPIRTMQGGRVQFRRDAETIDVGPQSAIQIADRTGKRYTTVVQHFGKVTIEAEVQNVAHFAVKTPHLAAVVKGTKFVVVSGRSSAKVQVRRGHVAVEDEHNHQTVTVSAGQSASTEIGQTMEVAGRGELPVVLEADGEPVLEEAADSGNGKSKGKGKSDDAVTVSAADGVSVNAGGVSVSAGGNSGNGNGNGNSGNGNSGNSNGNSGSENSGNSGNGNSGNGNGNSGNGNGNGGLVSGVVDTVGSLL